MLNFVVNTVRADGLVPLGICWQSGYIIYRKISDTRRTKSQTLNVYHLVLLLFLHNLLKQGVTSRMKM